MPLAYLVHDSDRAHPFVHFPHWFAVNTAYVCIQWLDADFDDHHLDCSGVQTLAHTDRRLVALADVEVEIVDA